MTAPSTDPAWDRIAVLFEQARELKEPERSVFLNREAEAEPDLLSEVRAMLQDDDVPVFADLERELGERAEETRSFEGTAGAVVGGYRLRELIGRGGMGEVYLAERVDGRFSEQRLAVKVLRERLARPHSVMRFERERRIQASLGHPSILALIDAGVTPEGRPFLVLPFVEGLPITRFADERRLSIEERLRIFIEVCRAVHYAHSRFVVHRDLKPSNILVMEDRSVRLLDFGIAKLLQDDTDPADDATRDVMAPMTPERAAPEQLRGDPVSTATDVWGLGVLLFELATGRLPFDVAGRSPADIDRVIMSKGAPPLKGGETSSTAGHERTQLRSTTSAQLDRWLRGDLSMIVAKALHVDPRQRYNSAAELAADVENVLAHRAVIARPDTLSYQLRRAASRRPGLTAALATTLIAFMVVGVLSVVSARRVASERDRATAEEARARSIVSLLVDLFGATAPQPGVDPTTISIDALLTQGAARADTLTTQPLEQAQMYATLGRIRMERSEFESAHALFDKALQGYDAARTDPGDPARAAAVLDFAVLLQKMDQPKEAQVRIDALLPLLPDPSRVRGRALHVLAESVGGTEGIARAEESTRVLRSMGATPLEIAGARNAHAILLFRSERRLDAHEIWKEVLPVLERDLGPDHPDTLRVLNNLATSSPNPTAQIPILQKLIRSHELVLGRESAPVSNDWNNLGVAFALTRSYKDAEIALRQSLELRRKVLGAEHRETISTQRNVARVLELQGRLDEALAEFTRVDALLSKAARPAGLASVAVQRGGVLLRLGRIADAERIAHQTQKVAEAAGESERLALTDAQILLGRIALSRADLPTAIARFKEALDLRQSFLGPSDPRLSAARAELGRALILNGDVSGRKLVEEALPILSPWGIYHPDDIRALEQSLDVHDRG